MLVLIRLSRPIQNAAEPFPWNWESPASIYLSPVCLITVVWGNDGSCQVIS
jgi:hypothetical protein